LRRPETELGRRSLFSAGVAVAKLGSGLPTVGYWRRQRIRVVRIRSFRHSVLSKGSTAMTRTTIPIAFILAALASLPACAQPSRVFVSGHGLDTNPCSVTEPCRTFQVAHNTAIANGEIDVLDPAGYGPLTISKGISIQAHGFGGITATSGNAITVAVTTGEPVSLNGLLIDGGGTGSIGIQVNSGASLAIDHCSIRHFGSGIVISPSSGTTIFSMSDSFSQDNSSFGLWFHSTGSGSFLGRLVRDELSRNNSGLLVESDSTTAFAASKVVVSESSANDNRSDGFAVSGGATLTLTRSISTGNFNGIGQYNGANNQVGVLQSYGDNRFVGDVQLNAPGVVMLTGNYGARQPVDALLAAAGNEVWSPRSSRY
jgi:hypothetical protein